MNHVLAPYEFCGRGELHSAGRDPLDVTYFILFFAWREPDPSAPARIHAGCSTAHGHLTLLHGASGPLDPAAGYHMVLADGQPIRLRLTQHSLEQFALYTFECAASELVSVAPPLVAHSSPYTFD